MSLNDPLSDLFMLIEARSMVSSSLVTGGDWSLAFDPVGGIKFNAVLRGSCWLIVEGHGPPLKLDAGDGFLLRARPFVLTSDPALTPVPVEPLFAGAKNGIAIHNPGGGSGDDVHLIGGRLNFDAADTALIEPLPPVIHFRRQSQPAAAMQWMLTRFAEELREPRPGGAFFAAGLMQMMFIEALRAYLASDEAPHVGWFAALADPRIGRTLRLVHAEPARDWTVEGLAAEAGMSRSNFAERFRALVGLPPLDYVLRWRMRLAAKALRTTAQPVSAIAYRYGYESEGGFSAAFRRVVGHAPLQYRRRFRG